MESEGGKTAASILQVIADETDALADPTVSELSICMLQSTPEPSCGWLALTSRARPCAQCQPVNWRGRAAAAAEAWLSPHQTHH